MGRSHVSHTISKWQGRFGISEWDVSTEEIDLKKVSVEYNGHTYFVGVFRDFDNKTAVIYHDIELDEESIIHELLHIVFPKPNSDETYMDYERWITDVAENLNKNEPTTTRRECIKKML
jgi:hypothetical protein